jgi:hypothetical protein
MSNRDLLKEAIADAKAVKEIAITNAKAALEEAFTPHLMSMFEKKLAEMEGDEDEHMEEAKMHDEKEMKEEMHDDETMEEDLELEALLRELEEAEEEESEEEESEEGEEEEEESEEDIELDFDAMEKDPEKFTEMIEKIVDEVIDEMIADGELEAGHEGMEDEAGAGMEMPMEEPAGEEMPMDEAKKKHSDKEKEHMKHKMKKMEEELTETLAALEAVKGELNEVNLLNSKLLYVNKIFKAKNLTEAQKVHVLAAFDKAETVKESKLIYETLKENLSKPTATAAKKQFVTESKSFASKSVGTAPKQPVVETDPMVERFKKLAGLK